MPFGSWRQRQRRNQRQRHRQSVQKTKHTLYFWKAYGSRISIMSTRPDQIRADRTRPESSSLSLSFQELMFLLNLWWNRSTWLKNTYLPASSHFLETCEPSFDQSDEATWQCTVRPKFEIVFLGFQYSCRLGPTLRKVTPAWRTLEQYHWSLLPGVLACGVLWGVVRLTSPSS